MRSAPTSEGLSTSTAIPVFTPSSTNSAFFPKYTRAISPSVQLAGGTTELIITPLIASRSSPASVKRFRVSTPYSSTVCSRAVVNRQLAISSSPRNTPSTVLVFPTSIVSSINAPPPRRRQSPSSIARLRVPLAAIPPARAPLSCPCRFPRRCSRARACLSRNSTPIRIAPPRSPRRPAKTCRNRPRIPAATAPAIPCAIALCPTPRAGRWPHSKAPPETSPDSHSPRSPRLQTGSGSAPHASPSRFRRLFSRESANHLAISDPRCSLRRPRASCTPASRSLLLREHHGAFRFARVTQLQRHAVGRVCLEKVMDALAEEAALQPLL